MSICACDHSGRHHPRDRITLRLLLGAKTKGASGSVLTILATGFRERASFGPRIVSVYASISTPTEVRQRRTGGYVSESGSAEAADVLQGGDDSALSRDRRRVDTRSSNRLASARILMPPADSGSGGSGLLLGLEERLELVRAQKRRTQTNLQSRRHHWSSEDAYIKYRTLASKRHRAKTGKAAEFPSPETLEKYKKSYWSQVDAKRQDMLVSEQSILDMEIEEAQLRAMLLECRSKASEAPTEPSTEGHAGASTSTSQSQGET
ncbi:hypothetical protein TGPRC2_427500, partial [Toxoplasma gondii TgCatPRC2]